MRQQGQLPRWVIAVCTSVRSIRADPSKPVLVDLPDLSMIEHKRSVGEPPAVIPPAVPVEVPAVYDVFGSFWRPRAMVCDNVVLALRFVTINGKHAV
jgi:hypothetical protein